MAAGSGEVDDPDEYTAVFGNVYNSYAGSSYINSNSKAKKWISWANQYSSSTNENIRSVSYMLDTNVWTSKYGDNNYADYVIGGPTVEMFVASWNTKHPENKIYCNGTGSSSEYGYYLGSKSGATTYYTNIGTSDSTYVKTDKGKAYGYWLASPSARGRDNARLVNPDGRVDSGNLGYYSRGFRPIVCLSSNIKLVSNGNGTYKLQK